MPDPAAPSWRLTRREPGAYRLHIDTHHRGDVKREHDRTLGGSRGYDVWVVDYAMRSGRWRRFEEFSTLKEAKAWIDGHLEELSKVSTNA